MNTSELITTLNDKGVRLWADGDRLRIAAPKNTLTNQLKDSIAAHKASLLAHLRLDFEAPAGSTTIDSTAADSATTECGLSLHTIGRLLGGKTARPIADPQIMATRIQVTFRPLPTGVEIDESVLHLREAIENSLRTRGVRIVPWQTATRTINGKKATMRAVCTDINAVIDVERPVSRVKSWIAEILYRFSVLPSKRQRSVAEVMRCISWAEDYAIQRLEDPTKTQVILLTTLDERLSGADVPYAEKIGLGVNALVSQFSEIVIGASADKISILNMNLSDSLFDRSQLDRFVERSLIPKIYVPIAPLSLSQFDLGQYDPAHSPYAQKLANLSQALEPTGLFPSGFKLTEVVRRRSHRDIVQAIVDGRTGVSYGFVAYAEPPKYKGPVEISAKAWARLDAVAGFSEQEVRQTKAGRRYLKILIKEKIIYKQVPDIWLVCSRSGANKTNLNIDCDVLRLGLNGSLQLQMPSGADSDGAMGIKPSYDTYVIVAIALAAALYTPELIQNGAPIIHFHGYPERAWFGAKEDYAGACNPAVPCGTYESGVFNFLSLHRLASSEHRPLSLVGLVEPDHGINLLAKDDAYLLERIRAGMARSQIELGGKYFASLMTVLQKSATEESATGKNEAAKVLL